MKTTILLLAVFFSAIFSSTADTWTQKADFAGLYSNGFAVTFAINGKGYLGAGIYSKQFWEYDPTADAWTQKADFSGTSRAYAVGFAIGNKGYVGTGRISNGTGNGAFTKDFWEYDQPSNIWTQKADFGGSVRQEAFAFSIGAKGYLGTGETNSIRKKDFWEYDPSTDTWAQMADYGGGIRAYATAFVIGNQAYAGCGSDFFGAMYKKDFWMYEPSLNLWSQKADFGGAARGNPVGFSIGSLGYFGIGSDYYGNNFNDFWDYDPATNSWIQLSDYAGMGGSSGSAFSLGEKAYVTGTLGNGGKELWQYTPDCLGITLYGDADADGYGDINSSFFAGNCVIPSGYVTDSSDCNDADGSVHPGAIEVCSNGIDDNCDGQIDDNCCSTPTGLTTTNITNSSAQLNWNTVASATKYKVQYKRDSIGAAWTTVTITAPTTTKTITGLLNGKKYKWKVKSVCGSGVSSAYSSVVKFTTLLRLGEESLQQSSLKVYPNPVITSSMISFYLQENSLGNIELLDLAGRKIKTLLNENLEAGDHNLKLNREQLSAGIYFMKIQLNNESSIIKIVIQ